jgi:hypothetical protein
MKQEIIKIFKNTGYDKIILHNVDESIFDIIFGTNHLKLNDNNVMCVRLGRDDEIICYWVDQYIKHKNGENVFIDNSFDYQKIKLLVDRKRKLNKINSSQ